MPECDICGRETEKQYVIDVEGATMYACQSCAGSMAPIEVIDNAPAQQPVNAKRHAVIQEEEEVMEGYGSIIRAAREKLGLTNKDLAARINEKESLLVRIERNRLVPDPKVAKKLEKALMINLEIHIQDQEKQNTQGRNAPITLGEAAIRKDEKR